MPAWVLSADQFAAIWYGPAHDRLPFPIRLQSRYTTADRYAHFVSAVRADLAADRNRPLRAAFRVLSEPEVRIEGFGFRGPGLATEVRVVGCSRLDAGVVAAQEPGPDGGRVTVRTCAGPAMIAEMVGELPAAEPGRGRPQRFPAGVLVASDPGPFVRSADEVPERSRYLALMRRAREAQGTFTVYRGPRTGATTPVGVVRWFDVAGDGRYTDVRTRSALELKPAGSADIVDRLSAAAVSPRR